MYKPEQFLQTYSAHPGLISRMARLFEAESARLLGILTDSLGKRDWEEFRRATHALRGAVSNYFYPDLLAALQKLEESAQRKDSSVIQAVFPEAEKMVQGMVTVLRSIS